MSERFTKDAQETVKCARSIATRIGHNYIGTEHILLALAENTEATPLLVGLGASYRSLEDRVTALLPPILEKHPTEALAFTPRAKKTLELSLREALSLGHNTINAKHILLGLVRDSEGTAMRLLEAVQITADQVRSAVIQSMSEAGRAGQAVSGDSVTVFSPTVVRVDSSNPAHRIDLSDDNSSLPPAIRKALQDGVRRSARIRQAGGGHAYVASLAKELQALMEGSTAEQQEALAELVRLALSSQEGSR